MKTCATCKESKPFAEFNTYPRNKDGYQSNCRPCARVHSKNSMAKRRAANPEKARKYFRDYSLKYYFNITQEDYEAMWAAQNGLCKVCNVELDSTGKRLPPIDHDHACCPGKKTCGKCIRAILCPRCNMLVGAHEKDSTIFDRVLNYVLVTNKEIYADED